MSAEKIIQLATVQERLHCLTPLRLRVCRGSHPAPTPPGTLQHRGLGVCSMLASVVCGYWDTYEGQDLVGSELVERLVSGGIFANPRMTRCRPALDTASSWERCQRAKLRRPQHALGEPCFDQLLSGLRRSARHSRSVKGGGASNPVSNVSMPSWCHLNHPSTAPPALGRRTCRWQCVFRFGSWDCRASVYRYQPPCSQVHQDPRHQTYWRRGRAQHLVPTSWTRAAMLPSRLRDLPRESVCLTRAFILFLV